MKVPPRPLLARVWDSCVITDYLGGKPEALPHAKPIVDAARRGEIQIWVSLFVEVEVAYLEGMSDAESERTITEFFAEDYVLPLMIDPFVSELARKLVRCFHVAGKDAVHVASAIRFGAPVFETFDKPLMTKLKQADPEKLLGKLMVREPLYAGARTMFDPPLPAESDPATPAAPSESA